MPRVTFSIFLFEKPGKHWRNLENGVLKTWKNLENGKYKPGKTWIQGSEKLRSPCAGIYAFIKAKTEETWKIGL